MTVENWMRQAAEEIFYRMQTPLTPEVLARRDSVIEPMAEIIASHTPPSLAALRSPAPAAPCLICGRVDDNHLQDIKHNQSRCVYCGSPMPKGEIRCQVCHPDDKHAPAATVTGWRLLEVGEVVQKGDECYHPHDEEWFELSGFEGEKVKENDSPTRRRLTPPAQGDEMRALCDAVTEWANNVDQYNQRDENEYCLVGDDELELLRSAVAAVRGAGGEEVA